jgi:hypothetical protein
MYANGRFLRIYRGFKTKTGSDGGRMEMRYWEIGLGRWTITVGRWAK